MRIPFGHKLITFGILITIVMGGVLAPISYVDARNSPGTNKPALDAARKAKVEETADRMGGCLYWEDNWGPDIFPAINGKACFAVVINLFLQLFSWVVEAGAAVIDLAVQHTIIEMAQRVNETTSINSAWTLIRDLANASFIFILLYIAIMTILGMKTSQMKTLLAYTIIIGLLVNFSLFFTQVIIDTSNIISVQFYDGITGTGSISERLLEDIELQTTYNSNVNGETLNATYAGTTWGAIAVQGIGGIILFMIVGFIFMAAGILLIIRFVVLIMLMILSPLAFVAYILPPTQKYFNQWLSKLLSEAFWAPIYFALLYIALSITNEYGELNKPDISLGQALQHPKGTGAAEVLLNFFIITFFFVAALMAAKSLGASGASTAVSIGNKWQKNARAFGTRQAGNVGFGGAGLVGRYSAGRIGDAVSKNEGLKKAAVQGGFTGRLAQATMGAGSKAAQSSFDVRATKAGKNIATAAGLGTAGGKGGYRQMQEDVAKKEVERARRLAPSAQVTNAAEAQARQTQTAYQEREMQHRTQINDIDSRINTLRTQAQNSQDLGEVTRLSNEIDTLEGQKTTLVASYNRDPIIQEAAKTRQAADELSGVDYKKIKERIKNDAQVLSILKETEESISKMSDKEIQEQLDLLKDSTNETNPEITQDQLEAKGLVTHKPAAQKRAQQYAQRVRTAPERFKYFEGVGAYRSQATREIAADAIMKQVVGQKSEADQILDVLKNSPDIGKKAAEAANQSEDE